MDHQFLNSELRARPIDVSSVENALIDLLVRAEDSDLKELRMKKGVMQLVETSEQVHALANLGKLTTEVELGGSVANALRGMALLGARTSYSSVIGNDEYGKAFSARLEQLSILNRLVVSDTPTGTCLVVVTPDGERTLNTALGACREYSKKHLPLEDILKSKIFFTSGYVWDTPNQVSAIEYAIRHANEGNVKVALDLADPFVVSRSGDQIRSLIKEKLINILFANAEEAHMMVGCRKDQAARILGEMVEIAVVKDGANGAFIASNGNIIHVPSEKTNVVDTTGAGDMFAGGFLYGVTRGLKLATCGKIASILAADTISHLGVRLSKHVPQLITEVLRAEKAE